jgi:hypothetical protein
LFSSVVIFGSPYIPVALLRQPTLASNCLCKPWQDGRLKYAFPHPPAHGPIFVSLYFPDHGLDDAGHGLCFFSQKLSYLVASQHLIVVRAHKTNAVLTGNVVIGSGGDDFAYFWGWFHFVLRSLTVNATSSTRLESCWVLTCNLEAATPILSLS